MKPSASSTTRWPVLNRPPLLRQIKQHHFSVRNRHAGKGGFVTDGGPVPDRKLESVQFHRAAEYLEPAEPPGSQCMRDSLPRAERRQKDFGVLMDLQRAVA